MVAEAVLTSGATVSLVVSFGAGSAAGFYVGGRSTSGSGSEICGNAGCTNSC